MRLFAIVMIIVSVYVIWKTLTPGNSHWRVNCSGSLPNLTDKEYNCLRSVAFKVIRRLGIIGECNIQYI